MRRAQLLPSLLPSLLPLLLTLLLAACAGEPTDDGCEDGDLRLCQCADGREGRRLCSEGSFASCVCSGAAEDASGDGGGAADSGAVDSATGTATDTAVDTAVADVGAGPDTAPECSSDVDCPDDGDKCNGLPECKAGVCRLKPDSAVLCDSAKDTVCSVNRCDPKVGACSLAARPDGTPCTDGDPCTVEDACKGGSCAAGPVSQCQCQADADCAPWEDGDLCTGTLVCDKSQFPYTCQTDAKTVVVCDAGKDTACQVNTCEPKTGACGLSAKATGTTCDDGDACTVADACSAGSCAGQPAQCECQTDTDCAKLEDGDLCNGTLICDTSKPGAHTCVVDPKTLVTCDTSGDTACLKSACDAKTGVCAPTAVKDQTACDDGDSCTKGDVCIKAKCQAGASICECQADADCAKADKCLGQFTCVTAKDGAKTCELKAGTPVKCDAAKDTACTMNTCAPATGQCAMTPANEGKPCSDGEACTNNDTCAKGVCQGQFYCECHPTLKPKGCAAKEDGNACNGTLMCAKGDGAPYQCMVDPKTIVSCDTTKDPACQKSTCVPQSGQCSLVPVADNTPCDDGDKCTGGDVCTTGTCKGPTNTCTSGPTWAEVYKTAFADEGCGGCHGSYNGEATAYNTLTQGNFCGAPLVKAGDAAGSSIVWKMVAGVALPGGCGDKMPDGSPGISAKGAQLLQDWIKNGAKK